MQIHNIKPLYNKDSKILILGSFPSVKSREAQFFYHHPQNRFWKILAHITHENIPQTIEEKKKLLLSHHIALWDVIESCEIKGSSDSSIHHIKVNDLSTILNNSSITHIYTNGKKSYELYQKYCYPITHIKAILLPSSSPANASYSLEKLIKEWSIIDI